MAVRRMSSAGTGLDRREALAAAAVGGVALAGAALGLTARRGAAQRAAIGSAGGIAGGGRIEGPDAAVDFSLFATRVPQDEEGVFVVSGLVRLADPLQGWTMESVEVAEYGPIDGDDENARRLAGTMRVTLDDAEAEYPFVLRVLDGGGPSEGLDTLTLSVGAAAGTPEGGSGLDVFSYEMNGTVSAGDIALVEVALGDA